jgi:superfamily II DNA or RNA helicase
MAEIMAYQGRYQDAARLYTQSGAADKAMEMFSDLRQFDEAKKWAEEYGRTRGESAQVTELINKQAEWSEEVEAQMLASLIALRKAMHKHPIRHAVSFHASIARAERFRDDNETFTRLFRRYCRVEAFHVSGKTPTGTRARVIEEFATAERSLVTNARCLTEGVDVPGIDAVLFADPRRRASLLPLRHQRHGGRRCRHGSDPLDAHAPDDQARKRRRRHAGAVREPADLRL